MLTYHKTILVIDGNAVIGQIYDEGYDNVYYLPFGYTKDKTTKTYPTVKECQWALEDEDNASSI